MKAKETILRKRLVSEGLPEKNGWYKTEGPDRWFNKNLNCFLNTSLSVSFKVKVEHWYEEETAHVLSDEELKKDRFDFFKWIKNFDWGMIGSDILEYSKDGVIYSEEDLYKLYQTTKQDESIR